MKTRRIALYSHDTMGIGHMRRNALIAEALIQSAVPTSILLIAGAREAAAFPLPAGVDCLTLPAWHKNAHGQYQSRHLDVSAEELRAVRARAIVAALEAFKPDVFIVDKAPRGALRELDPALASITKQGRTRCILGLRDVLDEPEVVVREWAEEENEEAIAAYYDAVWIYGDPVVYDLVRACRFSGATAAKARYTGFLTRPPLKRVGDPDMLQLLNGLHESTDHFTLCMVGGGQDGADLAEAFAQVEFPKDAGGVILTGPFMPFEARKRLCWLAAGNPRLRVLEFVTDPDLLLYLADRAILMGGYNSTFEVIAAGKPALIVPRVKPRREQQIRAEHLRDLGLIDMLLPEQATPRALGEWLQREPRPPCRVRNWINWNGRMNLPRLLEDVLTGSATSAASVDNEWRDACVAP
jgi:predicted glycosyltransferase